MKELCWVTSRRRARSVAWGLVLAGWLLAGGGVGPPGPAWAASSLSDRLFQEQVRELRARRGRAEAVASLASIIRMADDLPPGALVPILREVVQAERRHDPLVVAVAAAQLAQEERQLGHPAEARVLEDRLGWIGDFWVVGPFDAQGRGGIDRLFPPEIQAKDPPWGGPYPGKEPGKEREVAWRRSNGALVGGALFLDGLLRPDNDAVAYAWVHVRAARDQPAVLRLGSPGPLKVWVNGALVLTRNVVRVARPDQDAAAVFLRRGENRLLVKTVNLTGAWRIFARLTDAVGRSLPGVHASAEPLKNVPPFVAARSHGGPVRALGPLLQIRAQRGSAMEQLDYARYLALVRSEDTDERVVEEMGRKASLSPGPARLPALRLLADVAAKEDDRRMALETLAAEAVHEADLQAAAWAALGDMAHGRRRDALALTNWREALRLDPHCWPASLSLAAEEQAVGLRTQALARLAALPAEVQSLAVVMRARARTLEALGRRAEAEGLLASLATQRQVDSELLQDRAALARARGDLQPAGQLYGQAALLRPDLPSLAIDEARMAEGRGDWRAARGILESAAARLPDEPWLAEELGKLLARAGELPGARVAVARALALRPQNPALRRYAESLNEGGGSADRVAAAEDLAREFAADAESLVRKVWADKAPAGPDASVVLLDRKAVRVHRNGLSESFNQRLVQIQTEQGARDNQETFVRYTPGSQEVEIRKARVWRRGAGGGVETSEATRRDDRDLSEPWYGIYYDNRAEVVTFDGLKPGDVVEVQSTLADVSVANALADYFGDMDLITEGAPRRHWDYTLIGPKERTFYFNEPRVAGLRKDRRARGEEMLYRFAADNLPRIEPEPSMPGLTEIAPYLHVSTYRNWDDVGHWYWNLVADQLAADDDFRRTARNAVAGLTTVKQKVAALHAFVLRNTRYVGLEFGIHGYKPYKVTQILNRRFGDCKDKASLLLALLREVGIPAQLVLVRTRRGGDLDPSPASLAVFDHAITYVPALDLYLDGTAEFSGMTELPSQDQGVMVLRVDARGALLTHTPVLPSAQNLSTRNWVVDLDAKGDAKVQEEVEITGQSAAEWRQHYQTPGERLDRYGKAWNSRYPGVTVEALAMKGTDDNNQPVSVKGQLRIPRLGTEEGPDRLSVPLTAREVEFVRSYARLSARHHDLILAYPWQHKERLAYRPPAGWSGPAAPQTIAGQSPFGRYEVNVASVGGQTTATSFIDVYRHRISPAEYSAFRAFLGSVDRAFATRLLFRRNQP